MKAKHPRLRLFGLRVRQLRDRCRLSQEKLGERANMDPTYISGIERGLRNISLLNLIALAQALGVGVGDLVDQQNL